MSDVWLTRAQSAYAQAVIERAESCLEIPPASLLSARRLHANRLQEARWLAMSTLYDAGWTMAEIGAVFGVRHNTVSHHIAQARKNARLLRRLNDQWGTLRHL